MSKRSGPHPADENFHGVTEADLLRWVRSFVWSGEYDRQEVTLLIEEQLDTGAKVNPEWLDKAIRRAFAAKRKAEKTWPKVTDSDRLDQAFDALEGRGIIALQMAGFTQSEGLEEVEDEYDMAGGKKSNYAGHCFYTEQDQESAMDGGGLHIGFGHLSGKDAKGVEVGKMVRAELERAGLKVDWDETIGRRLYIKGFRWQRR